MARRRGVPDFTPEEMDQIEAAKNKVRQSWDTEVPVKEIEPPGPASTGSGQTSPKAGGSWWKKGGKVASAYCTGGKVISVRRM